MRRPPAEHHAKTEPPAGRIAWWTHPIVIGTLVYLFAAGVLSVRPSIIAWAFAPWADIPSVMRLALIGVGVILCVPVVAGAIDRGAGYAARMPGITLILSALAVAAFVLFRVRNHAIGDGYLLLGYLRDWNLSWFYNQLTQLTSQLGDLSLIWAVGHYITLPLGFGWADSYVIVGAVAGMAGLWAIVRFSRLLTKDRRGRSFVVFGCLTAGTVYMWFGHVESYTPAFVAGLWTCVLAGKASRTRSTLKWAWVAFAIAVIFHSISLCLLPMMIYVSLSSGTRERLAGLAKPVSYVAGGFVVTGLGASAIRLFGLKFFVPILPTEETAYAAFTGDHLLDMVNVMIRIAPLSLLAIPVALRHPPPAKDKYRPVRTVLAIVAAGTWYFIFWIDPTLGALRDWDLLAIASFPLTLWAVVVLSAYAGTRRRVAPTWVAVAVLAFAHIGTLVAANRDAGRGAASMERLLRDDVHLSGRYYDGARVVPWGVVLLREVDREDLAIEYFRRRTVAEPGDVIAWRNQGWSYYLLGEPEAARQSLESAFKLDSTSVSVLSYLGLSEMMLGDWASARDAFARRLALLPWDVEGLYGAGLACAYLGEDSLGSDYLASAIGLNIAGRHPDKLSDRDSLLSYSKALAASYESQRLSVARMVLYSELSLLTNTQSQAVRAASAAVDVTPVWPDAARQLALCMSLMHADSVALPQWTWYRARRPNDAVSLLVMGVVARRLGQTDLAIDCQTTAANAAPDLALPCLELSELYGAKGDAGNARHWAREYERRSNPGPYR